MRCSMQFISTAGETAIARYEKIFGITPMDTDTLAERRFKVLAKISCRAAVLVRRLRQQLETLCGTDATSWNWTATGTLTVKVALTAKRNQQAVEELLADIVPANMVCTTSLLYNTWGADQEVNMGRAEKAHLARNGEEVLPDGAKHRIIS